MATLCTCDDVLINRADSVLLPSAWPALESRSEGEGLLSRPEPSSLPNTRWKLIKNV